MHEMSIALEVCRMAEEQVGVAHLPEIVAVGLEVGDDAGVEITSLEFCLEAVLAYPPFGGARAVIARPRGDVLRLSYLELDDDRAAPPGRSRDPTRAAPRAGPTTREYRS